LIWVIQIIRIIFYRIEHFIEPGVAPMGEQEKILLEDEVLQDGLQMESRLFSFAEKVKIFHLLKEANGQRIQSA
jgi:hypothetical protein